MNCSSPYVVSLKYICSIRGGISSAGSHKLLHVDEIIVDSDKKLFDEKLDWKRFTAFSEMII